MRFQSMFLLLFLLSNIVAISQSADVIGKWKTIDDETGKPISVVEIFKKNGKIYGRVSEIFDAKSRDKSCEKCPGEDKGKPFMGLTVLRDLVQNGDEYSDGHILDPKHGKLYKCYITLEDDNKLKVRGYVGVSLFGRTQYWHRVQ
ncbi:MAG: DUF2147 domain-containing protein [Flavobacterium sp.]|nr:DUF2147 domain-containing protein [Flavobacterium sp.]